MSVPSDADAIAKNPIGDGLDSFRRALKTSCEDAGILNFPSFGESAERFEAFSDARNLVIKLFLALQSLPAAESLRSRTGRESLRADLLMFASEVISSDFDLKSVIPLLEEVGGHIDDQKIWDSAVAIVTPKLTPPTAFDKIPFDTPFKSTSSSQRANEQTYKEVDERILQEINGCVYNDIEGFYKKYFEGKSWLAKVERIVERANPQVVGGRWTEYPQPPSQAAFLNWFWTFQAKYLRTSRGKFSASPDQPLAGSDCKRKLDLFMIHSGASKHDERNDWADVRIIGELKQGEIRRKYTEELLSFCGHAREVFASQPTRQFLHGFFIRGSRMELWVFDRSGPYSSEQFDIHQQPSRFIKIMAGYTLMSDDELGLNTHINEDKVGRYILFKGDDKTEEDRLYLEDKPIAF